MGVRTGQAALRWAMGQVKNPTPATPSGSWAGYCLIFVRSCLGVSAKHPSAEQAYFAAEFKRGERSTPPPGVPVWWTNGRHGHVALSAGDGYCYSTDILRTGKVDKVPISLITRKWGQDYRGWTEDLNGVRVWDGHAERADGRGRVDARRTRKPVRRSVSVRNVQTAARRDHALPDGQGCHEADILPVERALAKEALLDPKYASDGYAGTAFRDAYARWQKLVVPPPYDGIPGRHSLELLGKKHGFRVVS
jgi:hypothetical protein